MMSSLPLPPLATVSHHRLAKGRVQLKKQGEGGQLLNSKARVICGRVVTTKTNPLMSDIVMRATTGRGPR